MKVAISKLKGRALVVSLLILVTIVVDRLTKQIVYDNFREVIVWNTGISLGFFSNGFGIGQFILHTVIILTVGGFIWGTISAVKKKTTYFILIPLGLIVSGGMSNLVDRVIWGRVLDFIPFFGMWTFNIADAAISTGIIMLAGYKILYEPKKRV